LNLQLNTYWGLRLGSEEAKNFGSLIKLVVLMATPPPVPPNLQELKPPSKLQYGQATTFTTPPDYYFPILGRQSYLPG
jgi:hypothetical protein